MGKVIAIYGKGGIGKSTTASNIAAACANIGYKVMLIGCDPKSDSSITLLNGKKIPTLLDTMKSNSFRNQNIIYNGYKNIKCIEVGGPEPGVGCAGRGIIVAIDYIKKIYPNFIDDNDLIIYDVPGDIVCGGFVSPIKKGFVEEVYIVTSGEYMSLYAANNLCKGFEKINMKIGGIICNSRSNKYEKEITQEFSSMINVPYIGYIPKNKLIQKSERDGSSLIEKYPKSSISNIYIEMANKILKNNKNKNPKSINDDDLRNLIMKYNS